MNIITAINMLGIIGANNQLIHSVHSDMKRFKELTTGGVVVMGRKTWESLPNVLSDRINIILSNSMKKETKYIDNNTSIIVVNNIEDVIDNGFVQESPEKTFIIGGSSIYKQFASYCDKIYLTLYNCFNTYKDCDTVSKLDLDHTLWKLEQENEIYEEYDRIGRQNIQFCFMELARRINE